MANPADIVEWYKEDLGGYAPPGTHCLVDIRGNGATGRPFVATSAKLTFFTDKNRYTVVAKKSKEGGHYLGCSVNSRKPRAGETWTRGRDMPDGELSRELWDRIVKEIVSYELVRLSQYILDNPEIVAPIDDQPRNVPVAQEPQEPGTTIV